MKHKWIKEDAVMSEEIRQDLQTYIANIRQFCMASNFQKMILSMIVGMRKQKEEL